METINQLGFNWADWIIVAVVILSALMSLARGFVKEALSLFVWVAAFVVGFYFSDSMSPLLQEEIPSPSLRYLAAFGLLFVGTLLAGAVVNFIIGQLIRATGLAGTDRLLGTMFGVCRGVLIVLAILVFLPKLLPVNQETWWKQSVLIPRVLVLENWAQRTLGDVSAWSEEQYEKHKPTAPVMDPTHGSKQVF